MATTATKATTDTTARSHSALSRPDCHSRPRVALLVACLQHGGTEIQTLHTARALILLGYQVKVFCLFDWHDRVRRLFEEVGAEVECLELKHRRNYPAILWRVSRSLRKFAPQFAHVQYIAPGLLSVLASRLAGVPRVLITIHQLGTPCSWFEHFLFRTATRLADLTICVSKAVEKSWFEHGAAGRRLLPGPGRRTVIYNCVERASCDGRPPAMSIFTIGYAGRIRAEKGLDILVRAAARLKRQGFEFRVVVAGDGPQRLECKELAGQLRVADRFVWLGAVAPDKLREIYRSFHVLVAPSRLEGFGLVAAEAMMHGVPVVAARTGGLTELVEHEVTGLLFQPEDPEDLAKAVLRIWRDPKLACDCSTRGQAFITAQMAQEVYWSRLGECYRALEAGAK